MALIVEDGTGKSDAESYISVADATAYLALHSNPTTWTDATEADQERYLRMATQYMDSVYGSRWKGTKNTQEQALDWPRYYVVDRNGYAIDNDIVPVKVTYACAELAAKEAAGTDDLLPDYDDITGIKKQRIKVGPIEDEVEYHGSGSHVPSSAKYRLVDALLQEYLEATNEIFRS